jgi:hypothetical protein
MSELESSTETMATVSFDYSTATEGTGTSDRESLQIHTPPVIKSTHKSTKQGAMRHSKGLDKSTETEVTDVNDSFSSSVSQTNVDESFEDAYESNVDESFEDAYESNVDESFDAYESDRFFPYGNFLDIQPSQPTKCMDSTHTDGEESDGGEESSDYTRDERYDDDRSIEGESFLAAVANVFVRIGEGDFDLTTDDFLEMGNAWTKQRKDIDSDIDDLFADFSLGRDQLDWNMKADTRADKSLHQARQDRQNGCKYTTKHPAPTVSLVITQDGTVEGIYTPPPPVDLPNDLQEFSGDSLANDETAAVAFMFDDDSEIGHVSYDDDDDHNNNKFSINGICKKFDSAFPEEPSPHHHVSAESSMMTDKAATSVDQLCHDEFDQCAAGDSNEEIRKQTSPIETEEERYTKDPVGESEREWNEDEDFAEAQQIMMEELLDVNADEETTPVKKKVRESLLEAAQHQTSIERMKANARARRAGRVKKLVKEALTTSKTTNSEETKAAPIAVAQETPDHNCCC